MPWKLKPLCVLMDRRLPTPVPSIALGHTWASASFLRGLLGPLGGWVCSSQPDISTLDAREGLQLERLVSKGHIQAGRCPWGKGQGGGWATKLEEGLDPREGLAGHQM